MYLNSLYKSGSCMFRTNILIIVLKSLKEDIFFSFAGLVSLPVDHRSQTANVATIHGHIWFVAFENIQSHRFEIN